MTVVVVVVLAVALVAVAVDVEIGDVLVLVVDVVGRQSRSALVDRRQQQIRDHGGVEVVEVGLGVGDADFGVGSDAGLAGVLHDRLDAERGADRRVVVGLRLPRRAVVARRHVTSVAPERLADDDDERGDQQDAGHRDHHDSDQSDSRDVALRHHRARRADERGGRVGAIDSDTITSQLHARRHERAAGQSATGEEESDLVSETFAIIIPLLFRGNYLDISTIKYCINNCF